MRLVSLRHLHRRPTAFDRLWIAVALTFAALGVALSVYTSTSNATLSALQADAQRLARIATTGAPSGTTAALARDIEAASQALDAHRRDFTLWAAAILLLAVVTVQLPAYATISHHHRRAQLHLRKVQGALSRLRSEMVDLSNEALHDAATGLPNGPGFRAALDRWLAVEGEPICVITVHVDTAEGRDPLPEAAVTSLSSTLRDTLEGDIVLARLSETEFGVMARRAPDALSDRILDTLDHTLSIDRGPVRPRVRIGYAVQHPQDATDLLAAARTALRCARSNPLDPVVAYCERLRETEVTAARLTRDLPDALIDGQIAAAFQPQICLGTGRLTGVEALARWHHPVHGELAPSAFFPIVRNAGLSYELDRQVWSHALRQMTHWRSQNWAIPHLALNASMETISDPGILRRILAQLAGLGLNGSDVVIEVPEQVFATTSGTDAAMNIERLMAAGIRVELDGLSPNLSSVVNLPERGLSGVKLDHALSAAGQTPGGARSVRAMMALLGELDIPASAKGIETDIQSRDMADAGCVRMQGNLVSAPMDAHSFHRWISASGTGRTGHDPAQLPGD